MRALSRRSPLPLCGRVLVGALLGGVATAQPAAVRLDPGDASEDNAFGLAVALSGTRAAVGAPGDGQDDGAVYVFDRRGGAWALDAVVRPSVPTSDGFGVAVDLDGDRLLVGAYFDGGPGAAYVFTREGQTWSQSAKLTPDDGAAGDFFGVSVALDGDRALVGASLDDDGGDGSGSAYAFVYTDGSWSQEAKLVAGDAAAGDVFGRSVALDGGRALVGAPGEGTDGGSGSAYVFARNEAVWSEEAALAGTSGGDDGFGFAVALEGDRALVGALSDEGAVVFSGAAYVFDRSGGTWVRSAKLVDPEGGLGDLFGVAVALDGGRALVSETGGGSESAQLFTSDGDVWTRVSELDAGTTPDLSFGRSVALDADLALVGAPFAPDEGRGTGAAFVFSGLPVAAERAPGRAALSGPFPNPSGAEATLRLTVDTPQYVRAVLYDVLGRSIAEVFSGSVAGEAVVTVPTAGLAPGVYTVRVEGDVFAEARRLVVAR